MKTKEASSGAMPELSTTQRTQDLTHQDPLLAGAVIRGKVLTELENGRDEESGKTSVSQEAAGAPVGSLEIITDCPGRPVLPGTAAEEAVWAESCMPGGKR